MGSDGDLSVSLPAPPPPNPAARRRAIDTALSKFDGIDQKPPKEPARIRWGAMNRRPAGALVAATLIAVIAIPAIQLGLPDRPEEVRLPEVRNEPAEDRPAPDFPTVGPPGSAADELSSAPSAAQPRAAPSAAVEDRSNRFETSDVQKAAPDASLKMRVAPAPAPFAIAPAAPPPPPAAESQADAVAAESDNIVVTGSRVQRPNLESASPVTIVGVTSNDFLSSLRSALDSNDRRAVVRLVAIPLRVNFAGERRIYRSSRDIERDFDRIFTPAVRRAVEDLSAYDLATRDGGRLRGGDRIWFGCGKTLCRDETAIKIREITP